MRILFQDQTDKSLATAKIDKAFYGADDKTLSFFSKDTLFMIEHLTKKEGNALVQKLFDEEKLDLTKYAVCMLFPDDILGMDGPDFDFDDEDDDDFDGPFTPENWPLPPTAGKKTPKKNEPAIPFAKKPNKGPF